MLFAWGENETNETPSQEELAAMAEQYGHTFPDLADEGWGVGNAYNQTGGIPYQALLAPGLEIVVDGSVMEEDIEAALPDEWP